MVSEAISEGSPFLPLYRKCCIDNIDEEAPVEDKQKGSSGMKMWARVHKPRLGARTPALYALSPTRSCTGRRNRDGPLGEEGGHWSRPLTTD